MSEQWPGEEPVEDVAEEEEEPQLHPHEHSSEDGIEIPEDVELLEGEPRSTRRGVGIVASREVPEVTNTMLTGALGALDEAGLGRGHVTVMLVPGAFDLALGAMALAKTRRYSCVIALGDASADPVVAAEAASGLQLAGLETGVPVAFGVLTAGGDAAERGADAARRGLEMADLFQQLRASAKAV